MIGMSFLPFLVILIISVVISLISFFVKGFRIEGCKCRGFCPLVIVGWIGGWLGSPVFGNWFQALSVGGVFIIPAILGSIAAICLYTTQINLWQNVCAKKEG